jgi:ankyrin repeat protein
MHKHQKGFAPTIIALIILILAGATIFYFWKENEHSKLAIVNQQNIQKLDQSVAGQQNTQQLNIELMNAIEIGDLEKTRALIKAGANVNFVNEIQTPLILASENGHLEIVQELIKADTDVNKEAAYGEAALGRAANVEILKELIKAGADVNKLYGYGVTPLMIFSEKGDVQCVQELIKAGADVNLVANKGWSTALIDASCRGYIEVVKELINASADVNKKDIYGTTALICASKNKHLEIVNLLEEAGAKN